MQDRRRRLAFIFETNAPFADRKILLLFQGELQGQSRFRIAGTEEDFPAAFAPLQSAAQDEILHGFITNLEIHGQKAGHGKFARCANPHDLAIHRLGAEFAPVNMPLLRGRVGNGAKRQQFLTVQCDIKFLRGRVKFEWLAGPKFSSGADNRKDGFRLGLVFQRGRVRFDANEA